MKKLIGRSTAKISALVLASALLLPLASGCGQSTKTPTAGKQEITIDYYANGANFSGMISTYFGKAIKDKFNMKINVIAPNISGQAIYQTRSAAGNLGDLVVLPNQKMSDAIKAGLIMDMSSLLKSNGSNYTKDDKEMASINLLEKNLETKKVYAIPIGTSTFSPTEPYPDVEGAAEGTQYGGAPYLRYDLYKQIGSPKLNSVDDLFNAIKQMQALQPTSDSGKKTYGFELFKDWDGAGMKCAWESFPTMQGYQFSPGTSTIMTYEDGTNFQTQDITTDNGVYYQSLQTLYKANQMGLVDPDSASQDWNTVVSKVTDGQTVFSWWSWNSYYPYNTPDRGNASTPKGFQFVPVTGQKYYDSGYNPNGQTSECIGIGSKAKDPARLMDFLNWLYSPEGEMMQINGPKGLRWDVTNGPVALTDFGTKALSDTSLKIPDSDGGGTIKDTQNNAAISRMINYFAVNSEYNVSYNYGIWPSYVATAATKIDKEWQSDFGAENMLDYCKKNNLLVISPGTSYTAPTDPTDIQTERTQCEKIVQNASWQMVFAKNEAAFNSIWANMKTQLNGLGWNKILEYDQKLAADYDAACKQAVKDAAK